MPQSDKKKKKGGGKHYKSRTLFAMFIINTLLLLIIVFWVIITNIRIDSITKELNNIKLELLGEDKTSNSTFDKEKEEDKKIDGNNINVIRESVLDECNVNYQRDGNDLIANRFQIDTTSRELYLKQQYTDSGEGGHWYGVEFQEVDNPNNVTGIYSSGDSDLLTNLPIQNKMRRCIYKNGKVVYYLDADNSELKADGTASKLDGTDGDVMVEIPEFFYKVEKSTSGGINTIRIKLSEQGIDGFNYSPKLYCSAYEATVNHTTGKLSSVCTATYSRSTEEVCIESANVYKEGSYSLGNQKTARRTGFSANAATYRGGTNDSNLDSYTDASNSNFCRNQLGLPLSNVNRAECKAYADTLNGEVIYQYDVHKALFYLSMVEYRTRNIQNSMANNGLGKGATVYPDYDSYEAFFVDSNGIGTGGLAVIPCGVTNSLGNKSGEVYYYMPQVPYHKEGDVYSFANVWMPCMSYRGIEHYYGHLYKIADQVSVVAIPTGQTDLVSGKDICDVYYYYHRNPFDTVEEVVSEDLIHKGRVVVRITDTTEYLWGYDGHILPINTKQDAYFDTGYCECTEFNADGNAHYVTYNGRIVSNNLVGRNFIVAYHDSTNRRANDGTRLVCYPGIFESE